MLTTLTDENGQHIPFNLGFEDGSVLLEFPDNKNGQIVGTVKVTAVGGTLVVQLSVAGVVVYTAPLCFYACAPAVI